MIQPKERSCLLCWDLLKYSTFRVVHTQNGNNTDQILFGYMYSYQPGKDISQMTNVPIVH